MDRHYHRFLASSLFEHRQMVFVSGARQVGKTTLAKQITKYSTLAKQLRVSVDTVRRWLLKCQLAHFYRNYYKELWSSKQSFVLTKLRFELQSANSTFVPIQMNQYFYLQD